MAYNNYSEKLKDPRWQKKRLEILNRDEWTCKICGEKTKTLHVHHWWYEKGTEPWDAPVDSLITLCEDCHRTETEERPPMEEYLIESLRHKGFTSHEIMTLGDLLTKNISAELVEKEKREIEEWERKQNV